MQNADLLQEIVALKAINPQRPLATLGICCEKVFVIFFDSRRILFLCALFLAGCGASGVPQTSTINVQSNPPDSTSTPPPLSAGVAPDDSLKAIGYVAPGPSISHVEHLTLAQQNALRAQGATSADLAQIDAENDRTNVILKEEILRQPQFFRDEKFEQQKSDARTTQAYVYNDSRKRPGVYYVTLDNFSSGLPVPGHAAMVSRYPDYTIEAYGTGPPQYLGVKYHLRAWESSLIHYVARTANATSASQDTSAAFYAEANVNKNYNWNFFNPRDTNSFYCSSLIWNMFRALGVDVVGFGWYPSYISPYHLYISSAAHTIYQQ